MLFLRYESFRQYIRLYRITSLILLINIAMFAVLEIAGGSNNPEALVKWGAVYQDPEYGLSAPGWRYFSAVFLHIGFEHLLFNSIAIFIFAPPVERLLGSLKYAVFYVGCGFIGNAASVWLNSGPFYGAGASGAIYGIYAAMLYLGLFRRDVVEQDSKKTIVIVLVIGVIYSIIAPHVDLYAHLGGFAGGMLLMSLFYGKYRRA